MNPEIPSPLLVADPGCAIGENPLWHPEAGLVFFLDIVAGRVYAYDPRTGKHRLFSEGPVTGGMALNDDGTLLLFQNGPISILGMDGKQRVVSENRCPGNDRFNDVIADPEGRVFAGTLGGDGRLIRFNLDGSSNVLLEGLGVANGMGFTPDLKRMHFTDSAPREIYVFDYDRKSGAISNQRVFATIPGAEGVPDGMAMDSEGHVWTAVWFGGRIKRFAPTGELTQEVHFPARQTSAPTFGGPGLEDVYVTTAGTDAADSMAPPNYDFSRLRGGGLYRVRIPGVRGRPAFRARVKFGGR